MIPYLFFSIACPPLLTTRFYLLNVLFMEREIFVAGPTASSCEASHTLSLPQREVTCDGLWTRSCGGAGRLVRMVRAPQTKGRIGEVVRQLNHADKIERVAMASLWGQRPVDYDSDDSRAAYLLKGKSVIETADWHI